MAFHWWSIPGFVLLVVLGLFFTMRAGRGLSRSARAVIFGVEAILLGILSFFAWWTNQGNENYYGNLLFLYSIGFLIVIVAVMIVIELVLVAKARAHANR
ncbi:MAG: hypothetical protein QG622_809 [Actinomycetota bacterium]|nr:hypothetical protein [Actinomycetota bacterium]